jgi:hypothetical protein
VLTGRRAAAPLLAVADRDPEHLVEANEPLLLIRGQASEQDAVTGPSAVEPHDVPFFNATVCGLNPEDHVTKPPLRAIASDSAKTRLASVRIAR